jgi:hypothetical protein
MNTFNEVSDAMIDKLSKYVLSKNTLKLSDNVNIKEDHKVNDNTTTLVRQESNETFYPRMEDTLFWCLFIHKFSKKTFLEIDTKYKNKEIDEKMKIVDFLTDSSKLKYMKISKTGCQEIRGDLSCSNKTNLFALHALSAFYNVRVFVVNNENKSYIEYNSSNEDNEICIVYKKGSLLNESNSLSKYCVELNVTPSKVTMIQEEYFRFDSYNKALKGISTYKLIDLENLANKMPGIINKHLLKKDLYEAICHQIM